MMQAQQYANDEAASTGSRHTICLQELSQELRELLARLDAAGLALPAIHVQTALELLDRD